MCECVNVCVCAYACMCMQMNACVHVGACASISGRIHVWAMTHSRVGHELFIRVTYLNKSCSKHECMSRVLYVHVAVCCSVWQCVAVCCSVLKCVAVCCGV